MAPKYQFNRHEFAGSLGDLGTILPLALGMILVNGLSAGGLFFSVGVFYIVTGVYYGIPVPVQPMKVIGAYSIATMMTADQIMASCLLVSLTLIVVALTGTMDWIGKHTPKEVIRGVQLSTGILLMVQGVKMMIGTSKVQAIYKLAEPHLMFQSLGPVPIGVVIGIAASILTLALLDSRRVPAGIAVVLAGLLAGLFLGDRRVLSEIIPGFHLPGFFPLGFPGKMDFMFAIFALVLPQIPMTLGNAVIANADLSNTYFGNDSGKMTYKSLCLSMAAGNVISFVLGGMPMCHGAGGLSAHYRFGARTAGSNLIIGFILIGLVLFLGEGIVSFLSLLPMAILGVLLVFAGSQLAMTIMDVSGRKPMFVVMVMLAITLTSNLAIAFGIGVGLCLALKSKRLNI